jgi:hypothetical protein
VIDAVQRLLREREPPAKPRNKAPEPAGPGWTVVPWDDDGVWLHIPPDLTDNDDEKETPNGSGWCDRSRAAHDQARPRREAR